uniref:putative glycine-rich cell wall structural protein 1 n=1 Tax=Fragaria vesca subsp. vesca TaxID=101020 RepID=UPI0005C8A313|nr:PREDICTED: putative glycine-rich cell wall structural protein 1 [Fragaria vesca subsp. vesca]
MWRKSPGLVFSSHLGVEVGSDGERGGGWRGSGGHALISLGFLSPEVAAMDKKVAATVVMVKEVEGGECDGDGGGGGDCEGGGGNDDEGGGGEGDGSGGCGEEVGSKAEGSAVEGLRRRRRAAMNQ